MSRFMKAKEGKIKVFIKTILFEKAFFGNQMSHFITIEFIMNVLTLLIK